MTRTRDAAALRMPTRTVLRELPERVVQFLRGVGSHAGARAAMAAGGYTDADHRESLPQHRGGRAICRQRQVPYLS